MSSDDWWNQLYGTGKPDAASDARSQEKKRGNTDTSDRTGASVPAPAVAAQTPASAQISGTAEAFPSAPDARSGNDGVSGKTEIPPDPDGNTGRDLRIRRIRSTWNKVRKPSDGQPEPTPAAATETDTESPEIDQEKFPSEDETPDQQESRIKAAKARIRDIRDETARRTEPARTAIATAAGHVSPSNGRTWSFLWSMGAAWTISWYTVITAWNHAVAIIQMPSLQLGQNIDWNFFNGPGRWFRDTLQASWESGHVDRILVPALVGILPVLVTQIAAHTETAALRKALMWAAYGGALVWICGASYIPGTGYQTWDEVHVSALAAATWWGTHAARRQQPGFTQFVLLIPLAAVVCGIVAYSPGAAF